MEINTGYEELSLLGQLVARGADSENCLAAARWIMVYEVSKTTTSSYSFWARAMYGAIQFRQAESIRLLLDYSPFVFQYHVQGIHDAHDTHGAHGAHGAQGGRRALRREMYKTTPIGTAVVRGYVEGVRLLYGVIPVADQPCAHEHLLTTAITHHADAVVDWMLDVLRVPVHQTVYYQKPGTSHWDVCDALSLAVDQENTYVIRRLVELGADGLAYSHRKGWLQNIVNEARLTALENEVSRVFPSSVANIIGGYTGLSTR
jgi:hypothetical protein